MNDKEFFRAVAQRAGLSREEAADVSRGCLATLADRISGGAARDLAAVLPEPLARPLRAGDQAAKRFDLGTFVRRVSEHTGLTEQEATSGVQAVFMTLQDVATGGQYAEVMAQLPKEFTNLAGAPA